MTEPEFKALLERYLSGQASEKEQHLLDQFFDSYRDQHTSLPGISEPVKEDILRNIRQRTDLGIEIVPTRRSYTWMAVAASVTLLAAVSYFFISIGPAQPASETAIAVKTVTRTTTRGQRTTIVLADGTQIRLNANSTLSYPERFTGDTREIKLEGEGYFEVAHDPAHPFIVHSGHTATRVLGTSFNVQAIPSSVTVTLVEGKVNIAAGGTTQNLQPNQQAVVNADSDQIATRQVDVSKYVGWTNNTLIFDHVTLKEAFAQMENWYNVDIQFANPALGKCFITARYENESLENVLNSLRFMLNVNFKIDRHRVRVDGKGCQ
jgi:ferric-dicitrate binding protein FerR (iron transport regulator)